MFYADTRCNYTEQFKPEHTYTFKGPCIVTGKMQVVTVKAEELYAYRQGAKLQDAFKSLSPDEREFLHSGMSAEGWDTTVPAADDDETPSDEELTYQKTEETEETEETDAGNGDFVCTIYPVEKWLCSQPRLDGPDLYLQPDGSWSVNAHHFDTRREIEALLPPERGSRAARNPWYLASLLAEAILSDENQSTDENKEAQSDG